MKEINRFDLEVYLPGQLLVRADRAGMMHSLEVRSPFLDWALAEFVFNLPAEYKTNWSTGKIVLKDLLREVMPSEFVDRPKQGFGAPTGQWLWTICRALVHDTLGSRNAGIYAFLDGQYVRDMVEGFYSGRLGSVHTRIWTLLCLELWFRHHRPSVT